MPLGLFAARCARATRKKPQIFKESATASSAQEEAEKTRWRKGAALKTGLEASEWPVSEPLELACQDRSRAGRRRLELPSLGAAGRRAHPPCPLPNG
jgi:hypothetical protein